MRIFLRECHVAKGICFVVVAGFVDVDGHVPKDRVMEGLRQEMRGPPLHWVKPGEEDPVAEHRPNFSGLSKIK